MRVVTRQGTGQYQVVLVEQEDGKAGHAIWHQKQFVKVKRSSRRVFDDGRRVFLVEEEYYQQKQEFAEEPPVILTLARTAEEEQQAEEEPPVILTLARTAALVAFVILTSIIKRVNPIIRKVMWILLFGIFETIAFFARAVIFYCSAVFYMHVGTTT